MGSLIIELQRDALTPNVCVSDLLRKAFVAAKKLRLQEFENWIELELNGYSGQRNIPKYRLVTGELRFRNEQDTCWRRFQLGSFLPLNTQKMRKDLAEFEKTYSKMLMWHSIGEIESFAKKTEVVINYPTEDQPRIIEIAQALDSGSISVNYLRQLQPQPGFYCNPLSFDRIVETIRTAVLQWALELEENGILGEGLTFTPKEQETASNITYNIEQFIHQGSHSLIQQKTKGTEMKIEISGSTVGMLNTGEMKQIKSISVNVSTLANSDQSQVAEALKNLTEAVAASQEITSEQQAEILDQLELLSEQATLAPPERKSGLIKPTLTALATTLSAGGGLAEIWSTWGKPVMKFFGVGG